MEKHCPTCKCHESPRGKVISKPGAAVEVRVIPFTKKQKESISRSLRLGKEAAYRNSDEE
jgi:hypothetical protein